MNEKHKSVCKAVIFLFILAISFDQSTKSYAGNMNENESQILSIVDRIYEYDGAFYKVNQEYYQKAVNYMMQDDVDLSKDDVVRVQNEMYSYIESAVVQGYLLPVEDMEQEIDKKENSENEIKKETQIPRNEESMNGEQNNKQNNVAEEEKKKDNSPDEIKVEERKERNINQDKVWMSEESSQSETSIHFESQQLDYHDATEIASVENSINGRNTDEYITSKHQRKDDVDDILADKENYQEEMNQVSTVIEKPNRKRNGYFILALFVILGSTILYLVIKYRLFAQKQDET